MKRCGRSRPGRMGGLVIFAAAAWSLGGAGTLAAETNAPAERIGIYDSRVIAYAHFWSDAHQRDLQDLVQSAQTAKAVGQTERFNELQAEIKREQEQSHLQVFSTAPVDEVLAEMKERLPAIEKEAGVIRLVSKWDEEALKAHRNASKVDVTDRLLREFKLDEPKLKVARDIRKQKPIPLDRARDLTRKGKL